MLPRKLLIPLRKEYPRLRKEGRWKDLNSMRLLITKNTSLPTDLSANTYVPVNQYLGKAKPPDKPINRFAIIVSKKVSLLSTERHEIKRRLSDAVVALLDRFPAGMDIVILAKKEALGKNVEQLTEEFLKLLPSF